jgi:protein-tyrosine phosphatase
MCRSPVAEALLRHKLDAAGVADVHVHSAGLLESGRAAPDDNVAVMAARGVDLSDHRSRRVDAAMLGDADLVIAMAREHVREVAVGTPDAWPRTFTLRELVRRGTEIGPRQAGQPLDEWLAKAHIGRTASALLGASPEDDVADPMGKPSRAYEQAAEEIDALVDRLVALVWGVAP